MACANLSIAFDTEAAEPDLTTPNHWSAELTSGSNLIEYQQFLSQFFHFLRFV